MKRSLKATGMIILFLLDMAQVALSIMLVALWGFFLVLCPYILMPAMGYNGDTWAAIGGAIEVAVIAFAITLYRYIKEWTKNRKLPSQGILVT